MTPVVKQRIEAHGRSVAKISNTCGRGTLSVCLINVKGPILQGNTPHDKSSKYFHVSVEYERQRLSQNELDLEERVRIGFKKSALCPVAEARRWGGGSSGSGSGLGIC